MYNTNVIDSAHRWNVLLYKYIKRRTPGLNFGLKYSNELKLFAWKTTLTKDHLVPIVFPASGGNALADVLFKK